MLKKRISFDRELELMLTGTPEYTLTREDIGLHLAFVYLPISLEGLLIMSYFQEVSLYLLLLIIQLRDYTSSLFSCFI